MKSYYSKKILKHFLRSKNMGSIKDADGMGDTANLKCGDILKIYIKIKKEKGKEIIKEAKFETLGCGYAIATSDIICELAKGKTIEEALKIDYKSVLAELGEVPSQKIHCAHLAREGLRTAIEDYKKKKANR